jgi:hypothetical protein
MGGTPVMRGVAVRREKNSTAAITSAIFFIVFTLMLLVILRSDSQGANWVGFYSNGKLLYYYDTDNMMYFPEGYFRAFTKLKNKGEAAGRIEVMDVDCKKNTVRRTYHTVYTEEGKPRLVEPPSVDWRTIRPDTVDSGLKKALCP